MENLFDELVKIRVKNAYEWSKIYKGIGITAATLNKIKKGEKVAEIVELKIKKYINENK